MALWVGKKVFLLKGSWACREHGNHKERQREPDSRRIAFIWESTQWSSLYSQINIIKKREAYKTGADQHLAILVSSEWRSYWQTSNNLPPFLPTGSQLQMTILNLHISVINSFEKSEVHANNQFGKTLQEDHDFSTCSKFTQGSIMLRDRTWSPSINAKS